MKKIKKFPVITSFGQVGGNRFRLTKTRLVQLDDNRSDKPNGFYEMSRAQVRKIFTAENSAPVVITFRFTSDCGPDYKGRLHKAKTYLKPKRVSIGCCVFRGKNFEQLRAWALAK